MEERKNFLKRTSLYCLFGKSLSMSPKQKKINSVLFHKSKSYLPSKTTLHFNTLAKSSCKFEYLNTFECNKMEAKCPADFEHPITFLKHTAERQHRLRFHISPRPQRIFHSPLGVRLSPFFPPPQITSFWQTNYDQSLREDAWE